MEFSNLENKRVELHSKYVSYCNKAKIWKKMIIVFFILFGLSGLIGVLSMSGVGFFLAIPMMFGFGLSGTLTAKYTNKAQQINKEYESKIKSMFIEQLLSKHYENAVFLENNHINIAKVINSNLIRNPDEFKGEDYISGYYKDLEFEFSELTLVDVRKNKDNKTTRTVYFQGFWLIINLPKKLDGEIIIIENNIGASIRHLDKIETEMIEFNNKFRSYSNNEQLFFNVINPYTIEKLLELESLHKGTILYSFKSNQLQIGVSTGLNVFKPDINLEITNDTISNLEEEVLFVKSIMDLLKLDDVKYK